MRIAIKAGSDVGKVREVNEDSYCILEDTQSVFICDGMGGHVAGATASKLAIDTIRRVNSLLSHQTWDRIPTKPSRMLSKYLYQLNKNMEPSLPELAINMINAIQMANLRIYNATIMAPHLQGMGTTAVGISFIDNLYCVAHVGDSRAYRIRNHEISQQTSDHSWLNELIQSGRIQPEEANDLPHKNVITRALGVDVKVRTDIRVEPVELDDIYLLCSDGLHDLLGDREIMNIINQSPDQLDQGVQALIDEANDRGGKDNITVTLLKVIEIDALHPTYRHEETIPEETARQNEIENNILSILLDVDFENLSAISLPQ